MEAVILQPPLYFAEDHIWDVCFHPNSNVIACSQISGVVQILSYNSDDVTQILKITDLHKSSVRTCSFNSKGDLLATGGKDKRIGFVDASGKIPHIIKKSHESSVNRVKFMDDQTLISGDDDGVVKIWDLRTTTCVFQAQQQNQTITGFIYEENSHFLLSSSLNGTIAVYDLRQGSQSPKKLYQLSDSVDQQFLGIQLVKDGKYVICPSSEGVIFIYKWDNFAQYSDKIHGHPNSIDAIIKVDQNTVITGSEDGFIRGVSIYPNKIVQVLGQHEQQQHFPIQSISLSHCRNIVASSSHDNSIKFYDVSQFIHKRNHGTQQDVDIQYEQIKKQGQSSYQQKQQQSNNLFEDIDSQSDGDSDQDSMSKKKKKKKKSKKTNLKNRKNQLKKQQKLQFFKDLE